jgi:hypothetical protein
MDLETGYTQVIGDGIATTTPDNAKALDGLLAVELGDELCACPLALAFKAHKVKIHLLALRLALSVDKETP